MPSYWQFAGRASGINRYRRVTGDLIQKKTTKDADFSFVKSFIIDAKKHAKSKKKLGILGDAANKAKRRWGSKV